MSFIKLLPVLSLIYISSSLLFPENLNILLCKNKCRVYSSCRAVRFDSIQLKCEIIFGTGINEDTTKKEIRIFKVQEKTSNNGCGQKERVFNNRRGSAKCVKGARQMICKTVEKRGVPCSGETRAGDVRSRCILYRRENISVKPTVQLIELNVTVKVGMKLVVYGESIKGAKTGESMLTITTDPEHATNAFKWFNVMLKWDRRKVCFSKGMMPSRCYKGDFPASDKFHFTVTVELTQTATKIFADKVLVKTIQRLHVIKEFNLHKYRRIHVYVVQKSGEECDKVKTGIP